MSTPAVPSTDRAPLDPHLSDLITEAVVWTEDAAQRAQILAAIVDCALEAIRWRLEPADASSEETSAQQVRQAVDHHLRRMQRAAGHN